MEDDQRVNRIISLIRVLKRRLSPAGLSNRRARREKCDQKNLGGIVKHTFKISNGQRKEVFHNQEEPS